MSVKWSRRFQSKLTKALTCFSKKRLKVVPVVNDPKFPAEVSSRHDRPSINEKSGAFSLVLRSSIFFTAETVLSFLLKLDIQCAVKAVEDSSNRLQDPSCRVTYSFNEESVSHLKEFSCFLDVLGLGEAYDPNQLDHETLIEAICQLSIIITTICNCGSTDAEDLAAGSLSLGDRAGAFTDIVLGAIYNFLSTGDTSGETIQRMMEALARLCSVLYDLGSSIDLTHGDITAMIWNQGLTKFACIIHALCLLPSVNESSYRQIAGILSQLSQCISIVRGDANGAKLMPTLFKYWVACDALLSCLVCAQQGFRIDVSFARDIGTMVYRALTLTVPPPSDLFSAVQTINSNYNSTGKDSCRSLHQLQHGDLPEDQEETPILPPTAWMRVTFALVGLQYILYCSTHDNYSVLKLTLPRYDEWIAGVGESLLICLNTRSKRLLTLSPLLAELLFQLLLHRITDPSSVVTLDWLFVELATRLSKFSESWKRNRMFVTRLSKLSNGLMSKSNLLLGGGGRSGSQGNVLTILNHNGGNDTSRTTGAMTTGRGGASTPGTVVAFAVGDAVDGQCTLQNGTQRWFAGSITKVNSDGTFTITFNDGDVKENVDASDIRFTKIRTRPNSRASVASTKAPQIVDHRASESSESDVLKALNSSSPRTIGQAPSAFNPNRRRSSASNYTEHYGSISKSDSSNASASVRLPAIDIGAASHHHNTATATAAMFSPTKTMGVAYEGATTGRKSEPSIVLTNSSADDSDDDVIFNIPTVFNFEKRKPAAFSLLEDNSTTKKKAIKSKYDIPHMKLDGLDLSSALPAGGSAFSLSGAILRETPKKVDDENLSPRSAVEGILTELASVRVSERDDNTSTALTQLGTWRDDSTNTGGSTRPMASARNHKSSSRRTSIDSKTARSNDPLHMLHEALDDVSVDASIADILERAYGQIAGILFAHCFLRNHSVAAENKGSSLDLVLDGASTPVEAPVTSRVRPVEETDVIPAKHACLLFSVREFLETDIGTKIFPYMVSLTCFMGPTSRRSLKLLSDDFFTHSCIPSHLKETDRIGGGGFGSVFHVQCPVDCPKTLCVGEKSYAVKRIPRERSVHDNAILFDILNEISCLEMLSHVNGVCRLVNFGVHGGEYWMVMEEGIANLSDWRVREREEMLEECRSADNSKSSAMTMVDDLLLCLSLFLEAVIVVNDVHKENIIHFDLKCSNFVLRYDIDAAGQVASALMGRSNNSIFLADFGEAVILKGKSTDEILKKRCRGTLCIQSPEMICLTEERPTTTGDAVGVGKVNDPRKAFPVPSKKSDVWSMGCLLAEILTGEYLFAEKSWTELYCMLCMGDYTPPPLAQATASLRETLGPLGLTGALNSVTSIIEKLLRQNPSDRASLAETILALRTVISNIDQWRTEALKSIEDASNTRALARVKPHASYQLNRNKTKARPSVPLNLIAPADSVSEITHGTWMLGPYVSITVNPPSTGGSISFERPRPHRSGPATHPRAANTTLQSYINTAECLNRVAGLSTFASILQNRTTKTGPSLPGRKVMAGIFTKEVRILPNTYDVSTRGLSAVPEQNIAGGSIFSQTHSEKVASLSTISIARSASVDHFECLLDSHDNNPSLILDAVLGALSYANAEMQSGNKISISLPSQPSLRHSYDSSNDWGSKDFNTSPVMTHNNDSNEGDVATSHLTVALFMASYLHFHSLQLPLSHKNLVAFAEKVVPWAAARCDKYLFQYLAGGILGE